jgi:hypothetical protein
VAQEQQLGVQAEVTVTFGEPALGIALVASPNGGLAVSGVRLPASAMGVVLGWQLVRVGLQAVPRGAQPKAIAAVLASAARPITLAFQRPTKARSLGGPVGDASAAELEAMLRNSSAAELTRAERSRAVELLHPCADLFNTNVMVLRPSPWTFGLLVHALDFLKAKGPSAIEATAFDSGFLSRFFGHYYEADPSRWLPFDRHLEVTLSPEHWPFHPSVPKAQVPAAAHSSFYANLLAWGQIASVDFSGPPALKPWSVLNAANQRAVAAERAPQDVLGAAWAAVEAAVAGGDGRQRRPVVDFYLTLWVQWVQHYLQGCAFAAATNTSELPVLADAPVCEFHRSFQDGFLGSN